LILSHFLIMQTWQAYLEGSSSVCKTSAWFWIFVLQIYNSIRQKHKLNSGYCKTQFQKLGWILGEGSFVDINIFGGRWYFIYFLTLFFSISSIKIYTNVKTPNGKLIGFEEQKVLAREVLQPIHRITWHYYFVTTRRVVNFLDSRSFFVSRISSPFLD